MRLSSSLAHELIACRAPLECKLEASKDLLTVLPAGFCSAPGPSGAKFRTEHAQGGRGQRARLSLRPRPPVPPPRRLGSGRTGVLTACASTRKLFCTTRRGNRGAPQFTGLAPGWPPNSQALWRSFAPPATKAFATASSPRPPRSTVARCGCCRRKVRPRPLVFPPGLLLPPLSPSPSPPDWLWPRRPGASFPRGLLTRQTLPPPAHSCPLPHLWRPTRNFLGLSAFKKL